MVQYIFNQNPLTYYTNGEEDMGIPTATLNADGGITFHAYMPTSNGNEFTQQTYSAEQVQGLKKVMASDVANDVHFPVMTPVYVLVANLAVKSGMITAEAFSAWAIKH